MRSVLGKKHRQRSVIFWDLARSPQAAVNIYMFAVCFERLVFVPSPLRNVHVQVYGICLYSHIVAKARAGCRFNGCWSTRWSLSEKERNMIEKHS